jgi:purine-binding chemotaxis protein CheW
METMRPLPVETFTRAPDHVAGLSIIRGQPTPVVSMRSVMGEASQAPGRYVTVKIADRVVALAFDAVLGVHGLSHQRAIDLPPLLSGIAGDAIRQIGSKDEALFLFLEAGLIFPPGLIETLDAERDAR